MITSEIKRKKYIPGLGTSFIIGADEVDVPAISSVVGQELASSSAFVDSMAEQILAKQTLEFTVNENGSLMYPVLNWEDLRFPVQGINPLGAATDPTKDTEDGCLLFSATAHNVIGGVAQMPHAWKMGSDIRAHIHWSPTTAGNGNMLWRLEYQTAVVGGVLSGTWTTIDLTVDCSAIPANQHHLSSFGLITPANGISSIIKWRISRVGNDPLDTSTNIAKLLEVDFHYQIDSVGSGDFTTK